MITWNPKRVYDLAIDIWFGDDKEAQRALAIDALFRSKRTKSS